MVLRDLLITPVYFFVLLLLAYQIRPFVTNRQLRPYFIPGLLVRFFGAIALGSIYQFYYGGGDTFNYFTHGSRWIWEAFLDDPMIAFKMIFAENVHEGDIYEYSSHIWYFRDDHSYFVVRIAGWLGLFTFNTYSAVAILFAAFSFSGSWAFYMAMTERYPAQYKWLAICVLFIPSIFFWGSGILKDTLTFGALGWAAFAYLKILRKGFSFSNITILLLACLLIYSIKVYILMAFVAAIGISYYLNVVRKFHFVFKLLVAPVMAVVIAGIGYYVILQIGEDNSKYAIDNIAETAAITSYDIRYGWGKDAGSGYDIGMLDGSWGSMFRVAPAAINVSLFRPYLWEVSNPLMLISALESAALLLMTIYMFVKGVKIRDIFQDPVIVFCFVFSFVFAFAVGVSTSNFGTLARYKIPLLPFYTSFLVLIGRLRKRRHSRQKQVA
ncbi:MAG: hypothetical protein RIC30_06220 [Marinoscillum sp.]|uniref:hypothetical protein n=1 Tax=Marinoscillum sp. TaxID=2024838 RepID=UPI0033009372